MQKKKETGYGQTEEIYFIFFFLKPYIYLIIRFDRNSLILKEKNQTNQT